MGSSSRIGHMVYTIENAKAKLKLKGHTKMKYTFHKHISGTDIQDLVMLYQAKGYNVWYGNSPYHTNHPNLSSITISWGHMK